jgi:hypothetical protein
MFKTFLTAEAQRALSGNAFLNSASSAPLR